MTLNFFCENISGTTEATTLSQTTSALPDTTGGISSTPEALHTTTRMDTTSDVTTGGMSQSISMVWAPVLSIKKVKYF